MGDNNNNNKAGGAAGALSVWVGDKKLEFGQRDFAVLAPDEWVAVCPPSMVPKVGVVKFKRAEANLWQPVILALPTLVYCGAWKTEFGCSWKSAVKLAYAGFVEYQRLLPRRIAINLESFFEHSRKVKADRHFWTPERRRRMADVEEDLRAGRVEPEEDEDEDANRGDLRQGERLPGL